MIQKIELYLILPYTSFAHSQWFEWGGGVLVLHDRLSIGKDSDFLNHILILLKIEKFVALHNTL